jgi:hypothetical protein
MYFEEEFEGLEMPKEGELSVRGIGVRRKY